MLYNHNIIQCRDSHMSLRFPKFARPSLPKTAKSVEPVQYLGEAPECYTGNLAKTNVILGELVVMNLDEPPQAQATTYVDQPARESGRNDFTLRRVINTLQGKNTVLHSKIHAALAELAGQKKQGRLILAVDAFIALAKKERKTKNLLICSGYETPEQTYFDTYLFRSGQLIRITEANIKPVSSPRYASDVQEQINDAIAEYDSVRIIWTPPLKPIELQGLTIEHAGPEIFKGKFPPVTQDGKASIAGRHIPTYIFATSIALCAAWLAWDVNALSSKRNAYDQLVQRSSQTAASDLELLEARARWQKEADTRNAVSVLQPAKTLLAATATNPSLLVSSISIATPQGEDSGADPRAFQPKSQAPLEIVLTAPDEKHIPALDQAQPIVAALKNQTGLNLYIGQQGIRQDTQTGMLKLSIEVQK